jgi:hypothetical protein
MAIQAVIYSDSTQYTDDDGHPTLANMSAADSSDDEDLFYDFVPTVAMANVRISDHQPPGPSSLAATSAYAQSCGLHDIPVPQPPAPSHHPCAQPARRSKMSTTSPSKLSTTSPSRQSRTPPRRSNLSDSRNSLQTLEDLRKDV